MDEPAFRLHEVEEVSITMVSHYCSIHFADIDRVQSVI